MLGLSEREQDLIHTAGLLHDIGKFIFPDSILLADRKLTDEEWETVKLHPEQGAKLVRADRGLRPGRRHHPSATTSAGTAAATPHGLAGEADPARLADHRRRRHLRRDDRARLLPQAGQLRGRDRRAAPRRRHPARPARSSRCSSSMLERTASRSATPTTPTSSRAGVRAPRRRLRAARSWPPHRWTDLRY